MIRIILKKIFLKSLFEIFACNLKVNIEVNKINNKVISAFNEYMNNNNDAKINKSLLLLSLKLIFDSKNLLRISSKNSKYLLSKSPMTKLIKG